MFRLIRYAILGALAFVVATWISESRGDAGIDRIEVTDPVSRKSAPTIVWYPTDTPAASVTLGPYTFNAARGAPPNGTARGLIVISHGSGGSGLAHVETALALVEAGYVVASPRHPGDNFADLLDQSTWKVFAGRPRTLSAVIDNVQADPRFAQSLNGKPVGAMGHSMGGYSVLALVGLVPDLLVLGAFCREHTRDTYCAIGAASPSAGERDKPLDGLADPRIASAVVMAPATALFKDDAFRAVSVPMRLYVVGQDAIVHPDLHAERFRDDFPPQVEYVRDEAAGHLAFTTLLPPEFESRIPAFLHDPPGFDRQPFLDRLNKEVVSFFERTLR